MLSKILAVGNKIEMISVAGSILSGIEASAESRKIYYSQIYDFVDENRIKIGMPIDGGKVVPVAVHSRYDACFFADNGLYQCRFVVVDRYKEDNIYVMVVELITELQRYQRRQFYRLGCTMSIKYRIIDKEELEDYYKAEDKVTFAKQKPLTEGIALDISGGGIRFVSGTKHVADSEMFVLLEVTYGGTEKIYGILGKIISMENVRNKEKTYEYRVEYRNIEGLVREEIIKFIFEEERKQRQKEKGLI